MMSDSSVSPELYKSSLSKISAKGLIQSHGMITALFSMDKINTYSNFEIRLFGVFFHLTILLPSLNH